ncbi:MAG: hypothetical protein FXF47_06345 [Candidatus Mcinerneyibacterium aminivorans]|uniref:Uncharacterized protein n=1 Tax=Candidatus Mcinerneyibacterium aminivorans TaxID=2703815 RepID=A0A5D0MHZ1_9BACT|nr:MAG: hypothetical protein FXF47_06345 [Candidatus Mcinerneyibacterium aminivorans]
MNKEDKDKKKFDEYYVEKLLFSRENPEVPEELKKNTLNTISKLNMLNSEEKERQNKVFSYIVGIFAVLMVLFAIVVAQNLNVITFVLDLYKKFNEIIDIESIIFNIKYLLLFASLIPAGIIFYLMHKKHNN